ncbi:MAG: tRNA dihydrouridine synthase DusB [Clostridia bacterium]|nr:tRNA dihydrouridine synthase DusB [Clostridia bacterium]MBR6687358.1 tRNA dihydrouridine synthase DusB [Clostridia bacterium]
MKIKSVDIGRLSTKNNIFLAPLAGFTDFSLRSICYDLGAGLCFTEMVSAKGLTYNNQNTKELLLTADNEYIKAVQLFGSEPDILRRACESRDLEKFDIIDINMGCPVPKVFNNGEGSKLLDNIPLAQSIVKECVKSGKTITVKMRLGTQRPNFAALDLAKAVEQAGASMVTVHGRYRDDYYRGEIDYDKIAQIKGALKIPVIANGNLFSVKDAELCLDKTGADGVMLARGALSKPWLFSEIQGIPVENKKEVINRHIDLLLTKYSDQRVAVILRKQMALYVLGQRDAKKYKQQAFEATSTKELKQIINNLVL